MNIPNIVHFRSHTFDKEDKPHKHIKRISQAEFEKGDPDFVDERTKCDLPKKKETFLSSLFD